MQTVVATKTIKWEGRTFEANEPLDPQPEGQRRAQLVNGRFARLIESPEE
jgi:hypothetical protein